MKEKELRFALVCYGGVSLAVYMHGVTKEILKLVRATREYHALTNTSSSARTYDDVANKRKDQIDTERVYFELLRQIGRNLDLRVVVDIIAGASAGGINGVILARALAHDLNIDPLRDFWLKHSDETLVNLGFHPSAPGVNRQFDDIFTLADEYSVLDEDFDQLLILLADREVIFDVDET